MDKREYENDLIDKVKTGCNDSFIELLALHEKFIHKIGHRYKNRRWEKEDLEQEARYFLYKAALKFDRTKGYQFNTLAYAAIRNGIFNLFRNKRVDIISIDFQFMNDSDLSYEDVLEYKKDNYEELLVEDTIDSILNEQEKLIYDYRFNKEVSQKSLAPLFGVSPAQISRLESRMKKKLIHEFEFKIS